jgi:hypothetical protein
MNTDTDIGTGTADRHPVRAAPAPQRPQSSHFDIAVIGGKGRPDRVARDSRLLGTGLSGWLGHKDPGFTLRVYMHVMPDAAEQGRSVIDAVLTGSRVAAVSVAAI